MFCSLMGIIKKEIIMASKSKVGLVGVTGYTGMELTRILAYHPSLELVMVTSRKEAGTKLSVIYPFLREIPIGDIEITVPDLDTLAKTCDIVFLAIPHGAAMEMGADLAAKGVKVVDLSADFRIRNKETYESWYNVPHTRAAWLDKAVYGLPELYADKIKEATLIANPGCYPTASILGLYPALQHKLIHEEDIIIDAKSGTTGAGRGAKVGSLFCEVSDSFKAYSLAAHRHTPEIEQELGSIAGNNNFTLSFTPHLLPINRGILATIYTKVKEGVTYQQIRNTYESTYAKHRFVRVLPEGAQPEVRNVRGTMYCDIALVHDPRTGRLLITSAIDNLCRGASGQAVANANLMSGLALEEGLKLAPLAP